MIKLCGNSITFPLFKIFTTSLKTGVFPDYWKKGNIVLVHKKSSKEIVSNYRPISLLPIFSKVFEKIIFQSIYKYFHNNDLQAITYKQSGFRPRDSCVNQLISITHEIYRSFDCNPSLETRGVFLDMSKAFDKVWHKGLIFKLKSYGVENKLLDLLKNYLRDRQQRVILN